MARMISREMRKKRPQATPRRTSKARNPRGAINIPWKVLGIAVFIALPFILLFGAYEWIKNPKNLTIKTVEVAGKLNILDKKQLQPVIEKYAKTNLHLLDEDGLEKEIEANPWVLSASLTKIWPDKLIVKIREQQPVAFWGKDAMLSQQGNIIKASLSKKQASLPMLYSPESKGRNMATGFLQIRSWLKDFPLKMVEFKEDARGSWQIKLENGLIVKIGRNEHQKRIRRFLVGYKEKLGAMVDKVHTVDLRYTNGFAVKWKNGLSADSLKKG